MNSKNSLILLIAIVLVVGQIMGEDSTIAAVAASDTDELQASIEESEAALEGAANAQPAMARRAPPARRVQAASTISNEEFYGSVETFEPEISDYDPDADEEPDEDANVVTPQSVSNGSGNVPFDPRTG